MTDASENAAGLPDPEHLGAPLSAYAAVMAYIGEGLPLDRSLDHAGISAEKWPAIEAGWTDRLGESAAEGPTLIEASDAHGAAARAHVERALPPLDEELKAWIDFFRAFTTTADPLGFLAARGLLEGDVFRLLDLWQARLSAEPALRDTVAALFAAEPGEAPEIRAGAPRLKPETRRARPAAKPSPGPSLAATITALPDLTKLPLPFVKQGDKPIVFEAERPRSHRAPNPLGETKMAFTAPVKAALPFPSSNAPPITTSPEPEPRTGARDEAPSAAPLPPLPPSPRSPLAETSMDGFELAKIVLPFKAGIAALPATTPAGIAPPKSPFGGTSLAALDAPKPALPFAAEGSSTPTLAPAPRSALAGTSLAPFEPPKAALPFAGGASPAAQAQVAALLPPAQPLSTGTSLAAFDSPKAALPFPDAAGKAPSPPLTPAPRLALRTYATLHAEIAASPANAMATIARYGLTPEGKRSEDAAWQARFVTDPELRTIWMRELVAAGTRLRGG